jgi:NAD kinase
VSALAPRVVLVYRRSEYEQLLARHGTHGQAEFFLASHGRSLAEVAGPHAALQHALTTVAASVPLDWRRGRVERSDLDRFLFAADDVVVAVGQDGLVANVAKYLDGQPVIGINPDPARNPGVLVPHPPSAAGTLLRLAGTRQIDRHVQTRTMVEASCDGQRLIALNEIYLGHPSHQTARYTLRLSNGPSERQASSGVLVGTGTGATGWCLSSWRERRSTLVMPTPTEPVLSWFVREAWPSPTTGTSLTEGLLDDAVSATVAVESEHLVAFGDGIESDALRLDWGQNVVLRVAAQGLRLVR